MVKKMLLTSSGGGPSMPTAVCGIAPRCGSLSKRRVCMRRLFISCAGLALALGGFAGNARAQFKNGGQAIELRLPTLSQRAIGTQRIGLTDITVNYCRPLVGGREIWGKAVPYGQTWRSGANENTTISFTDDVSVEGHALPAAFLGLHIFPPGNKGLFFFQKTPPSGASFVKKKKKDARGVKETPNL